VEPIFLPDGRHYLSYVPGADSKQAGTYVGSVDSADRTRLLDIFHDRPAYSPDGHLLFVEHQVLMAQPFDTTRLRLSGAPIPLEEHVSSFSVAQGNTLAFTKDVATELAWFDRTGHLIESIPHSEGLGNPVLSPDDSRIAANRRVTLGQGIWLADVSRPVVSRFTVGLSAQPVWSPDGHDIVFSSGGDLYRRSVDGGGEAELLLKTPEVKFPHDWSSDRRFIVYATNSSITHWDLWLLPLSGDRKPMPFLRTEFNEFQGQVSSDGRWIAYVSDESGVSDVFIQSFPVPGSKRQVSTAGGKEPKWRRDGKELFYLAPDRSLMAVEVTTGQGLDVSVPKVLFHTHASDADGRNRYAVSRDGQRFLIESRVNHPASTSITVVLNWPTVLAPARSQ
jgi:dipeptidyl aminopeptidase/acylaminoacyl peptidase